MVKRPIHCLRAKEIGDVCTQATYSKFKCSRRHIGKREDPGDEVVYE